jgi:hypothetical protein
MEEDALEKRDAAPPVAELLLFLPDSSKFPVVSSLSDHHHHHHHQDEGSSTTQSPCPHLLQLPGTPLTTTTATKTFAKAHQRNESSVSEISIMSDDYSLQTNDEQQEEYEDLHTSFHPLFISQEIRDMEQSLERIRIYNHERKETFTSYTSDSTQNTLEFFNALIEQQKQQQRPSSRFIQKPSFHRRVSNDTLPPIQSILSNNNNHHPDFHRSDMDPPQSAAALPSSQWMWITGQN